MAVILGDHQISATKISQAFMPATFRSHVQQMAGYVPGEQPQEDGWTKLNTNENPYPPSPKVVEAIRNAASGRLNVYPDPMAMGFRKAAAKLFDVSPEWILPANGSDENLTIELGFSPSVIRGEIVALASRLAIEGANAQNLTLRDKTAEMLSPVRSFSETHAVKAAEG